MSEKIHIPIAKHLEDEDNLLAISNEFKILLFCVSPKKRAIETAELVEKELIDKEIRLRIISEVDTNLREIDQGKFILPNCL